MQLTGRTVLVTGGSRGIGYAVTRRLARAGAHVVVNYRHNEEAAEKACASVRAAGGSAEAIVADVGDSRDVRALLARIQDRCSHLDSIVHCAAVGRFQPLLSARPAEWESALRINAHALLLLAREAIGTLREPGGTVVALSSLGSRRYVPFYGAIGASKAALESVVRYLAVELAPRGVRVNCVSAGLVDGETLQRFPQSEALRAAAIERTPASRLGTPEEVAEVVLFLIEDRSSWIYGQTLLVDGGASLL